MGVATCCNVGCFCIANWVSYGLYDRGDAFQWRFPLGIQLVFLFAIAPILLVLPDSPRWLLLKDRDQEALLVLSRLHGHDKSVEDSDVLAEYASIKMAIKMERQNQVPMKDVLRQRDKAQNLRRLLLSCGTQFFQQFTCVYSESLYDLRMLTNEATYPGA